MASPVFQARIKWFFNTPEMMARLGKWRHDTLARVGAYGLGVLRNKLNRPQPKYARDRTVTLPVFYRRANGSSWVKYTKCLVQQNGLVIDKETGRPIPRAAADDARAIVYKKLKGRGEGRPPRRGPTGKLRRVTDFGLDPRTETVVIGVVPFPSQPPMYRTVSVPEMLDVGGAEVIDYYRGGSAWSKYGRRPYLQPTLRPTQAFMNRVIKMRPAGR